MKIFKKSENKEIFIELEKLFQNENKFLSKIINARTLELENFKKFYEMVKIFYLFLESLRLRGKSSSISLQFQI